jgi:membrane associated rhomboid family serine protease
MRWLPLLIVTVTELLVVVIAKRVRHIGWLPRAGTTPLAHPRPARWFLSVAVSGPLFGALFYTEGKSVLYAILGGLAAGVVWSVLVEWSRRRREARRPGKDGGRAEGANSTSVPKR